jgi:predicted phage terminase large subunit-like protein
MKTLTRNSQILSCSPRLVLSPSMAHVNAACRKDFVSFVRKTFHVLAPSATFYMNWHICAIAHYLEQVRLGKITRLIITVPPRSLKSIMCSVAFPAFVLGHDAAKRVIVASYGADLAIKHGNDFRVVVNSAEYRGIFPGMRISAMKNTQTEVVTTRNGFRLATSVDGALTGRGGDIIIIDDAIDALAAVISQKARDHVRDWYFNTLLSRLDDKRNGAIVLVMQRLHEDDLAGVLLRGSDEWTVLSLPAIAEQDEQIPIGHGQIHYRRSGDVLHPEREPREVLESRRAELGAEIFAAQYQQQPVAPGGAMIKRDWLRRYDQLPKSGQIIQSWDVASKQGEENDYSVCTTWLVHENKYYLMHVLRGRFELPTLRTKVSEQAKLHKASQILIEDTGFGTALIQELKAHFSIIAVKPEYAKKIRMAIQSGKFENGQVFFPKEVHWLADLEAELFAFPNGRHDDQVDSISQALAYKSRAYWTDASLEGHRKLITALSWDAAFWRLAGRPW